MFCIVQIGSCDMPDLARINIVVDISKQSVILGEATQQHKTGNAGKLSKNGKRFSPNLAKKN